MTSGDMKFSVRPVFIGWITLLVQLPLQLFFTLWAGAFFGGLSQTTGLFERNSHAPFIIFGALAFFGIPAVAYLGKRLNYSRTEYRFFDDHLEFEEGFFSINKKVIRFRDVKEVTMRQGILQRIYGLGTIYLATLATGSSPSFRPFTALGFGNVSGSGISVRDICDPDQTFDRIRQLVDAYRD
ncbi:MAG TPA: PH domain-containing protein [Xanthobacteraceae bacterium]|nr:PH domain-containing protein [Xanthobacteraceae bacterium]